MASPLADLYQRYKIGTRRVEKWLTDLANRDSIIRDVIAARKMSTATPDGGDGNGAAVKLTTKELIAVTDRIVEVATAKKRIPEDLGSTLIILEDVISGRREYKLWHQQQAPINQDAAAAYTQDTRSHEHFVFVLGEILERLKAIRNLGAVVKGAKSGKRRKKGPKSTPVNSAIISDESLVLSNVFGGLTLEEPSNDPNEHVPSESASTATPAVKVITVELEKPGDEDQFALWCFLKDCRNARLYLRSVWQEQAAGKLSMQVASEVTDIGLRLLCKATDEFKTDFPHLASFDQVADRLEIRGQCMAGKVENFSYTGSNGSQDAPAAEDAMELLCIPAFAALFTFMEVFRASIGDREDTADVIELAGRSHIINLNMQDALTALFETPEMFGRLAKDGDMFDLFTTRFITEAHLLKNKISITEVVQYQICMDILDVRDERHGDILALCLTRDNVRTEIQQFEKYAPEAVAACNLHHSAHSLPRQAAMRFIGNFLVDSADPEDDLDGMILPQLTRFFISLPVSCGMAANFLLRTRYADGILTCRGNTLIMALAHLYRASLEAGLLRGEWDDMEFVIDQLGPTNLGLLGKPGLHTPIRQSAQRFGMAFGILPSGYSKANRKKHHDHTSRIPLPQTDSVAKQDDVVHLRKSAWITALLQGHERSEMLGLSDLATVESAVHRVAQNLINDPKSAVEQSTRNQWQACKKLDIATLLELVKHQLAAEDLQRFFNFHAFYVGAARHLHNIRKANEPDVTASRARRGLSGDFNMVEMVDEILWASAGSKEVARSPLGILAIGFNHIISKHSSRLLDSAKEQADSLMESAELNAHMSKPCTPHANESSLAMSGSTISLTYRRPSPEELSKRNALREQVRRHAKDEDDDVFSFEDAGGESSQQSRTPG